MTTQTKPSGKLAPALELFENHIELAYLDCRYEMQQTRLRLLVELGIGVCLLHVLVFLQIALFIGLIRIGIPLYFLCLLFAALYTAGGFALHHYFINRDSRVGEPFQGSREELTRTLRWIRTLLS